jgi:ABC-2 type transport system permease protein
MGEAVPGRHRARRRPVVPVPGLGDRPTSPAELPLQSPASTSGLLEVFRRRYLLRLLVRREISARYQGSVLGMLWSYVNPLSQFLIYYIVIGVILNLHKGVENFAIHIFTGLIIVHFFNETVNAGTRSIVRNRALVQKMALPREMFPVASMLVSAFHIGPQLVILTAACAFLGWTPDPAGLAAAGLGLLLTMATGTALALLLSAANVFLRDISNAVNILTNVVRFGVPMIYPFSLVSERFGAAADYYLWNPLANAVLMLQKGFWVGSTDDPAATAAEHLPDNLLTMSLITLGASLVLLAIAQVVFSKLENKIPERL